MNLLSPTVLGAAGVCTSPALYQTLVTGGVPLEVAMTRYLDRKSTRLNSSHT